MLERPAYLMGKLLSKLQKIGLLSCTGVIAHSQAPQMTSRKQLVNKRRSTHLLQENL